MRVRLDTTIARWVNVTKARREGLFADDLARLQPTPGYTRLLKESVLQL